MKVTRANLEQMLEFFRTAMKPPKQEKPFEREPTNQRILVTAERVQYGAGPLAQDGGGVGVIRRKGRRCAAGKCR